MDVYHFAKNKPRLDLAIEKQNHFDILEEEFWHFLTQVHDYTELPTAILFNLYTVARYIAENKIEGDFVECGVLVGGSIMMVEHVLKRYDTSSSRRVFALDTFRGFVRRDQDLDISIRDGRAVCHPSSTLLDYSDAAITNMKSVGYERLVVLQGDVLETIPTLDVQKIALLRLDTDTYDTTKFELETLYDRVVPGGVIIVDDYGYTLGCKKAVDDFISNRAVLLQRLNPNVRTWVKTTL